MVPGGKRRLEHVAFAILATLAVVLLGFFAAVLVGAVPVSEPAAPSTEEALGLPAPPAETETEPETVTEAEGPTQPATTGAAATTTPNAASQTAVVTLVAARGDCWVVARRGGPDGEVLHEALVPAGERVTLRAPRVWLQLGAAANVDVLVDGRRVAVGAGTLEFVVPAAPS